MGQNFRWIGKADDGESIVLRRFRGNTVSNASPAPVDLLSAANRRIGVVLDVETTGTQFASDHVIEIGIRKFAYDSQTGQILERLEGYGELEDPGIPVPENIQKLTGITTEMVQGKKIDWDKVNTWIREADIVIAHNASFDRPFVQKYCSASQEALWGCTFKQIDWVGKGFPSAKLEILSIYHGFFVDAHRALEDSDALLHLVSFTDDKTGTCYLSELLATAQCKWVRIQAKRSAFEKKDVLKSRKYKWDQVQKFWYLDVVEDVLEDEKQWLSENVYSGAFLGDIQELSIKKRFLD